MNIIKTLSSYLRRKTKNKNLIYQFNKETSRIEYVRMSNYSKTLEVLNYQEMLEKNGNYLYKHLENSQINHNSSLCFLNSERLVAGKTAMSFRTAYEDKENILYLIKRTGVVCGECGAIGNTYDEEWLGRILYQAQGWYAAKGTFGGCIYSPEGYLVSEWDSGWEANVVVELKHILQITNEEDKNFIERYVEKYKCKFSGFHHIEKTAQNPSIKMLVAA